MINKSNLNKKDNLRYSSLNQNKLTIFDSFIFIWRDFENKRKIQLLVQLLTIILGSFSEILLIMTFIPFLSILNNSNFASERVSKISILIDSINFGNNFDPSIKITILFCIVVLLSTSMRLLNAWISARLSAAIGVDLSAKCFKLNLSQTYEKFLDLKVLR